MRGGVVFMSCSYLSLMVQYSNIPYHACSFKITFAICWQMKQYLQFHKIQFILGQIALHDGIILQHIIINDLEMERDRIFYLAKTCQFLKHFPKGTEKYC